MADLTRTEAAVAVVFPLKAQIHTGIAAEAVEKGQVLYILAAGTWGIADANAAGKQQARGIALQSVGAGQALSVLKEGHVAGFTITQDGDSQLFLSDTAGAIADAAGTMTVPIGRVVTITDKAATKVAYLEFEWNVQWS